ncbi:hypothetical protein [Corallococcus sp. AB045]|nr:hypothetical protein [Corallococcus sp. AB045]
MAQDTRRRFGTGGVGESRAAAIRASVGWKKVSPRGAHSPVKTNEAIQR